MPIRDVLLAFAEFSGHSIVAGEGVEGTVTADLTDQPWDVALEVILASQGLVASENEYGIIRVDNITDLNDREAIEPIETPENAANASSTSLMGASVHVTEMRRA